MPRLDPHSTRNSFAAMTPAEAERIERNADSNAKVLASDAMVMCDSHAGERRSLEQFRRDVFDMGVGDRFE